MFARAPGMRRIASSKNGLISTPAALKHGYERYREVVLDKQKSMDIVVPLDTKLLPVTPPVLEGSA
ncbi:hypothetical protein A8144_09855 [Mycobacterium leprae 3125609]|nr:hypothetical protein A8144_09855 [Mycobacterium leprae 3125609]OAX70850.1 hypothetical protein A3216_09635 [Mycobacterium leprae 7935681]